MLRRKRHILKQLKANTFKANSTVTAAGNSKAMASNGAEAIAETQAGCEVQGGTEDAPGELQMPVLGLGAPGMLSEETHSFFK